MRDDVAHRLPVETVTDTMRNCCRISGLRQDHVAQLYTQ